MQTKHFIFAIIIILVAGLVILVALDIFPIGSIIAGVSGLWAALKSKLLRIPGINTDSILKNSKKVFETPDNLKDSHLLLLKEKLDYLEYKTARMEMQLEDLKKEINLQFVKKIISFEELIPHN